MLEGAVVQGQTLVGLEGDRPDVHVRREGQGHGHEQTAPEREQIPQALQQREGARAAIQHVEHGDQLEGALFR